MRQPNPKDPPSANAHHLSHLPPCTPILHGCGTMSKAQTKDDYSAALGPTPHPVLASYPRGRMGPSPGHSLPTRHGQGDTSTLHQKLCPQKDRHPRCGHIRATPQTHTALPVSYIETNGKQKAELKRKRHVTRKPLRGCDASGDHDGISLILEKCPPRCVTQGKKSHICGGLHGSVGSGRVHSTRGTTTTTSRLCDHDDHQPG
jgi:hypothetical protein